LFLLTPGAGVVVDLAKGAASKVSEVTMSEDFSGEQDAMIITGDFVTNGRTFVFRLAGSPHSGVGASAGDAFDDLIRSHGKCSPLADRVHELARDQQDENVRSTTIKMAAIGLIVFGVAGGVVFASAAILPRLIVQTSELAINRLSRWVEDMPVERQEKLLRAIQRFRTPGGTKGVSGSSPGPNP
jgi:hypothetical protein